MVEAILYGAVIVSDDTANRIHTLNGLDIMALIHGAAVVSDNAANVLIAGDGAVIIALVHGSPTVSNYAADVLAVVGALRLCLGACNTFYDTQVVRVFYIAAATGHAANAACADHYAHIRAIQNIGGVVIITDHAADVSCAGYVAGVCAALDGFATPAEQTADVIFTADEPTVFAFYNGFYPVGSISDHAAHVLCADYIAVVCALVDQVHRICVANHAANVLLAGHRAQVLAKEQVAARFEISDHAADVILTLHVGISDRTAVHSAGHVAEQALIVVGAVDINVRNRPLAATECSRVGSGAASDGRPFSEPIKRFIRAIFLDRCTNIEVDRISQGRVCACILRRAVGQSAVDKPCKPEQLACVGNFVIAPFLVIYCGLIYTFYVALSAEAVGVCPEGVGRSLAFKRSIVCIAGSRTVTLKALIDLVCIGCEYGSRIGAEGLTERVAQQVRNLAGGKLRGGAGAHVTVRSVTSITADGLLCGIAVQERAIVFTRNAALVVITGSCVSCAPAVLRSTTIIKAHDAAGINYFGIDVTGIVAVANGAIVSAHNAACLTGGGSNFTGIATQLHSAVVSACDTANAGIITAYNRIVDAACDNTVVSACDAANTITARDGGICEGHSLHLTVIVNIAKQTNIVSGAVIEVQPGDGLTVAIKGANVFVGRGADGCPRSVFKVDIRHQLAVDFGIAAVDLSCKPVKLACVVDLIIALCVQGRRLIAAVGAEALCVKGNAAVVVGGVHFAVAFAAGVADCQSGAGCFASGAVTIFGVGVVIGAGAGMGVVAIGNPVAVVVGIRIHFAVAFAADRADSLCDTGSSRTLGMGQSDAFPFVILPPRLGFDIRLIIGFCLHLSAVECKVTTVDFISEIIKYLSTVVVNRSNYRTECQCLQIIASPKASITYGCNFRESNTFKYITNIEFVFYNFRNILIN